MQRRELKMAEPKRQFEHVPFDTLSYAKRLQSSGFTQEQAEVQAETFFDIVQDQLISKRDMFELERNLKLDIENVRLEIANVKKDLMVDIESVRLEIANVKKDLTVDIENVRLEIANVKKDLTVDIENVRLEIANVKKDLTIDIENIRKDIKELETRTQAQIEILRRDLKIWFGGMLVVAVGVLSGMMTVVANLSG